MQRSTVKKGAAALLAVVIVALAFVAALPWLASTQIVRDRIAYELSLWSGYRVDLGEAPHVAVWPSVTARLSDVSLYDWTDREGPPVVEAEQVEIDLSAWAALRGDIKFSSMRLTRPLLRLARSGPVIDLPASPAGGRMVQAVETARALVAANPASPDLAGLPDHPFGQIEFSEGRVVAVDGEGTHDVVTSLSGRLGWPALNRPANLAATGIWRGENVSVEGSSAQPLILLASGSAPMRVAMTSPLISGSFDGVANLSADSFFDGTASLSSPSLRRTLEWSQTDIAPGAAIGSAAISGRVTGNAQRLKLEDVKLELGANAGTGVLDVSFADAPPAISGTLDFGRLDISSFMTAFSPIASGKGNIYDQIDTSFAEQLSLDLRLSADAATIGTLSLVEVAAAVQIKGGLTAFDISDATAFGGTLQAGIRIDRADAGNTVEMRFMANEIDAGALAQFAGMTSFVPQGRADMSLILKGLGRDWNTAMGNAEGSITATMGPGTLAGFDLTGFRSRWADGEFFALADVASGSVPVRGIDIKATVRGGIAQIDRAQMLLEGETVSLEGIVPYFSRALALSGHFTPVSAEGVAGEAAASFFIGGAWDAPYVSPIVWREEMEPDQPR